MANQTPPRRGRAGDNQEQPAGVAGASSSGMGETGGFGSTGTSAAGAQGTPVRDAAATVGEDARAVGATFADRVKERAASQLDSQKQRARQSLGGVAQFVRQATEQIDGQGHQGFADYGRKAADTIERFGARIDEKDLDELLRDVEHFARRQPALFVGAAFGVGVLAGRFLRSSNASRPGGRAVTRPSSGSVSGTAMGGAPLDDAAAGSAPSTPGAPSAAPAWDAQQTVS